MIKTENESDAAALSQMQKNTTKVLILMNNNSFITFTYKIKTENTKSVEVPWSRPLLALCY